jgi:hypothetical protein
VGRLVGLRWLIGCMALAAGCLACQTVRTPLISVDAARSAAVQATTSSIPVTVMWARLSSYGREANGGLVAPAGTPVWAVAISGSFPVPCGPASSIALVCPDDTTELIIIDATTGAFIQGNSPAPSRP